MQTMALLGTLLLTLEAPFSLILEKRVIMRYNVLYDLRVAFLGQPREYKCRRKLFPPQLTLFVNMARRSKVSLSLF